MNTLERSASLSEDHGILALTDNDLKVYSVGISSGGVAEIRMAQGHSGRHVIASTIDAEGADFARKFIAEQGRAAQIAVKIEDVKDHLPYENGFFDFIPESIREFISDAGFSITSTQVFDENLYTDFMRTKLSPKTDNVIELLAVKHG